MSFSDKPVRCVAAGVYRVDVHHPGPQTTCAYVIDAAADGAAVIDCGGGRRGAAKVMEGLATLNIAPAAVRFLLVTHAHLDHAGAAGLLMQQLPQATFAAHAAAVKHLTAPATALEPASRALYGNAFFEEYYGGLIAVPAARARALEDGEALALGRRDLRAVYTPGHAWHHMSFYDERASFVAAGDAFGVSYRQLDSAAGGAPGAPAVLVPVTPPSQYAPAEMRDSIRRLAVLNAATVGLAHYDTLDTAAHGVHYMQTLLQALDEWDKTAAAIFAETGGGGGDERGAGDGDGGGAGGAGGEGAEEVRGEKGGEKGGGDIAAAAGGLGGGGAFYKRMKAYLLEWAVSRSENKTLARLLHNNDASLSARGFEYYLKKNAAG